jgi:HlyD family secretion protein
MKILLNSPRYWLPACLALLAAGYWVFQQAGKVPPEQRYRLQAIEQGDVRQTVSANGTINPVSLISVGTQVSGMVKKLYVDFNSKVSKGQVLLELDQSMLTAQLKQTQANIQSANAALELATANEARMRDLYTHEYVSRQELDASIQSRKAAQAQSDLYHAALEKDRANLAYSVIRSPVSGIVVDRQVDVGQTVAASLQTPTLFKIAQDLAKMQIHASFAEADIGNIRPGLPVWFTVDAFSGQNFHGKVAQIRLNPTTQQNVVTYDVVVDVDNPDKTLLPGMTAYVNIMVDERKNVLLIPNAALRFKPAGQSETSDKRNDKPAPREQPGGRSKPKRDGFSGKVYVLRAGQPEAIRVGLGITDNRNTEVTEGDLKIGDQVILGETSTESKPKASAGPPMRMF